jgi:serine/threonine protein kinase
MISGRNHRPSRVVTITPRLKAELSDGILVVTADKSTLFEFRWGRPHRVRSMAQHLSDLVFHYQANADGFDVLGELGSGLSSNVMLWREKRTQQRYAVKLIDKARLLRNGSMDAIFRERAALLRAHHPFIVQLHFTFETDTNFVIGLEYVPGGELFERVERLNSTLPMGEVQLYVAEIATALNYLHTINIIYRDLKPENILLDAEGHIKLTDFGSVKISERKGARASAICGTSEYLAPEILNNTSYTGAVDWWALGILTYELLFGKTPFSSKNESKMFHDIVCSKPRFRDDADPTVIDFIKKLLKKDPQKRLNFRALKKHAFFHGMNFKDVQRKRIRPAFVPPAPKAPKALGKEPTT